MRWNPGTNHRPWQQLLPASFWRAAPLGAIFAIKSLGLVALRPANFKSEKTLRVVASVHPNETGKHVYKSHEGSKETQ